ncbi:hypothetical protein TIFTF001_033312 [Ficus carica]|uniref:Uncharacterized protein n=1 Tax=Ficus carica TaxID=3494 RepID=A0AA88DYB3_FICCA|nr:hypothetical protein TIFTF001_033312 [Ficus carica]
MAGTAAASAGGASDVDQMESLLSSFHLIYQVEHRTTCQSLKEQVKSKNHEQREAVELINQEHAKKIANLEAHIRRLLLEKETNEATVNHLRQDLEAHRTHINYLAAKLDRVQVELDSKYKLEIRALKDCVTSEQEEKIELNKKLQHLEKECCRTKLVQQQQQQQPYVTSEDDSREGDGCCVLIAILVVWYHPFRQ